MLQKRKAFTIVEFIVAISITMIMAAGISVVALSMKSVGTYHTDKALAASVATAASRYRFEVGSFPNSLNTLTTANAASQGPWLNNTNLKDSSGQALIYKFNSAEKWFKVYSVGANKADDSGSTASIGGDDVGVVVTQ